MFSPCLAFFLETLSRCGVSALDMFGFVLLRNSDVTTSLVDGVSRVAVDIYSLTSYVIVLTTTPVMTHTWLFSISDKGHVDTQHT